MTSSSPPIYTRTLRGKSFTLSHSQISFDSPNFFTAAFLGDFAEASSRTLSSDRRPELFRIIFKYLAGYDIFPIELERLSELKAAKAIRKEAEYFQLERLLKETGSVYLSFKTPLDFASLRKSGSIEGRTADQILTQKRRPYQLFRFNDLQLR